ncbi:MAG: CarD family transcriptional regulator, partial [Polyangiaceae bacterium]
MQKAPASKPAPPPPARSLGAVAATTVIPIPIRPAVSFKVGDKCVHPAHGVGVIVSIDQLDLGGTKGDFYKLQIIDNGLRLLVPVSATNQAGLRPIMSSREADRVIDTLKAPEVAVDVQPWSRRFRLYTEMVKSGIAIEIAKVLRDISRLRSDKDLSFGERKMLDTARSLLLKELSVARGTSEVKIEEEIERI